MLTLAQTLVAWVGLFVAVGGVALCAPHLGRSKWVTVVAGAFAIEAFVLGFYRLSSILLSVISAEIMSAALLAASVVLVFARIAIVAGVVGLISELPVVPKTPAPESFGG